MTFDPNNGWHLLMLAVFGGLAEFGLFALIGYAIGRSNARLAAMQIELASLTITNRS